MVLRLYDTHMYTYTIAQILLKVVSWRRIKPVREKEKRKRINVFSSPHSIFSIPPPHVFGYPLEYIVILWARLPKPRYRVGLETLLRAFDEKA